MEVHEKIANEFRQVFAQDGFGRAGDRSRVLEAFLAHEDHTTAEELAAELGEQNPQIDVPFVREVLEQFVHYGLAVPIRAEDGKTRFDHVHIGRHHDHIICVNCGRVVEVECPLTHQVAEISKKTGFQAVHTHLQIHGICPTCTAERPARFPLDQAAAAEKVRVVSLGGGHEMTQRLTDMGLRIGSIVRRQNTNWFGPVIVSIGTTRLAVGRGMARRIIVEELTETASASKTKAAGGDEANA